MYSVMRFAKLVVLCLSTVCGSALGQASDHANVGSRPINPRADRPVPMRLDAGQLAAEIDRAIHKGGMGRVITPDRAGDAAFMRRVALDVGGCIPTAWDVREFLASSDPYKRKKYVEHLLDSQGYIEHFTNVWSELLVPEARDNSDAAFFSHDFVIWLRNQFRENAPFDRIAKAVITVPVSDGLGLFEPETAVGLSPSPFGFLAAKQAKPEQLAASTSRVFLGIQLECAQCHDHPFASWKQKDFWGFAAFFGGLDLRFDGEGAVKGTDDTEVHAIRMHGSSQPIQAQYVDGSSPRWRDGDKSRRILADWITSRENPFFARAIVNRVWSQFFGIGLINPVDDMLEEHDAKHTELLDLLAQQWSQHDFDLKYLIRAITSSYTYQLTSAELGWDGEAVNQWRLPVRGLTPDQLYDSLCRATGFKRELAGRFSAYFARGKFLKELSSSGNQPSDPQISINQVLLIMNGELVANGTDPNRGPVLAAIVRSDYMNVEEKLEALYFAALTRPPRPDERAWLKPYISGGGPTKNESEAFADVFWALVTSPEFSLNQ